MSVGGHSRPIHSVPVPIDVRCYYNSDIIVRLCAARLQDGGNRVTVVARGQRLADIRRYGLVLEDVVGHGRSTAQLDTTERLGPNDQFDAALIAVRRDQVASVVPELTANYRIPTLIMEPGFTVTIADAIFDDAGKFLESIIFTLPALLSLVGFMVLVAPAAKPDK
jgi:hypothetical protein